VSDRGPGLPAGSEDQVFAKFYRGPQARAARPGGAGLGLAVCRGIVNAHGGAIEARRRPGGGATFHLWLPGGDAPAEPQAAP
jgi:two-component system sensor histidine kinase KdpD